MKLKYNFHNNLEGGVLSSIHCSAIVHAMTQSNLDVHLLRKY